MTDGMVEISKARLSVWASRLSYFIGLLTVFDPGNAVKLAEIRDEIRRLAND